MTEADWLNCLDPTPMLEFLRANVSDRKLRLFACGCCRRIWQFITDPGSQAVVGITEQSADGLVDVQQILSLNFDRLTDDCGGPEEPFRLAFMVAGHVGYSIMAPIHGFPHTTNDFEGALETAEGAVYTMAASFTQLDDKLARFYNAEELLTAGRQRMANAQTAFLELQAIEKAGQSSLLRCIFGNPFRLVPLLPSYLHPTLRTLAHAAYDDRQLPSGSLNNQRLEVLADALEGTGCTNADILNHCRQMGVHVRGCWVVDLILGKE